MLAQCTDRALRTDYRFPLPEAAFLQSCQGCERLAGRITNRCVTDRDLVSARAHSQLIRTTQCVDFRRSLLRPCIPKSTRRIE